MDGELVGGRRQCELTESWLSPVVSDALDRDGLLSADRDLQRCVSLLVPLLLRDEGVHRLLAPQSDDEGLLDPLQKVHSSKADATRAGNRRLHQSGKDEGLHYCDTTGHEKLRLRFEIHR
jgi:hypothetical protein